VLLDLRRRPQIIGHVGSIAAAASPVGLERMPLLM
jgi:hypothetical protein